MFMILELIGYKKDTWEVEDVITKSKDAFSKYTRLQEQKDILQNN